NLDNREFRSLNMLGLYHVMIGNLKTANDYFERVLPLNLHDVIAHNMLGLIALKQGQINKATTYLGFCHEQKDGSPYATLLSLGYLHLKTKDETSIHAANHLAC